MGAFLPVALPFRAARSGRKCTVSSMVTFCRPQIEGPTGSRTSSVVI